MEQISNLIRMYSFNFYNLVHVDYILDLLPNACVLEDWFPEVTDWNYLVWEECFPDEVFFV